jgi:hypothetical protein
MDSLQVIEALRGRLKERVEDAFGSRDPKTVCQNMCAAVRTALQVRHMQMLWWGVLGCHTSVRGSLSVLMLLSRQWKLMHGL